MPTTILKAPVGAGKTEAVLRILSQTLQDEAATTPFVRVWVLLASRRQEVAFRQRLVDYPDNQRVYFNVEFFNFYELNARLLNMNRTPPRRIQEVARYRLLAAVLRQLDEAGALTFWREVAQTAGFVRAVAALIDELKQNLVHPQAFIQASATAKERELGEIYAAYQATLQTHHLVDLEGEAWLALETLRRQPTLARSVRLLLVDGYDQFTPVQAEIVALLARHSETYVTLTVLAESERQRTVGKRFEQAMARLEAAHAAHQVELQQRTIEAGDVGRAADLQVLARHLFSRAAPTPASSTPALHLVEVPQEGDEVAEVLRRVKALLLAGVRPDEVLIAVRDWGRYAPFFETYRHAYQLPLLLHYAPPLAENPVLVVFLGVLRLSRLGEDGFETRQLLDVLRSPYVRVAGLDAHNVSLLEQVAQRSQVVGGREAWLAAVAAATKPARGDHEDLPPLLEESHANALQTQLKNFFDLVTPPPTATMSDYVAWIEGLLGADVAQDEENADDATEDGASLGVLRAIRALSGHSEAQNRLMARDLHAVNALKTLLHGFVHAEELLETTLGQSAQPLTWQAFWSELEVTLASAQHPPRDPARSGRVLVTTANNARGLPHPHVFILGLAEGLFPKPVLQDPLLLESERAALAQAGVRIETQAQRVADEGLFYELISLARNSLTLSRPTVQEGKLWNESHLWRMVRAVFTPDTLPVARQRIGEVVALARACALDEVLLAVADGLQAGRDDAALRGALAWLLASDGAALWQRVAEGRAVEVGRMAHDLPFDAYSGVLQDARNLAWVARTLHDARPYSATQLNHFGSCHYQFFAKRLLKLEALKPIQEGMDVLQRGTLYHAILEATYAQIKARGWRIEPAYSAGALDVLAQVCVDLLGSAPERYGFRPSALWQQEMRYIAQKLAAVVRKDFETGDGTRTPHAFELGFEGVRVPLGDPRVPYVVLRGSIDRVDISPEGLHVIDYKSGSTPYPTSDLKNGRNFQMWTYVMALRQLMPDLPVLSGAFWRIETNETGGAFVFPKDEELLTLGTQYVAAYLAQARAGSFAVQPRKLSGGKCSSYCEFAELCRVARTSPHKPHMEDA